MFTISNQSFKDCIIDSAGKFPYPDMMSELFKHDGLGIMVCKLPTLEMIWGIPQNEDFFGFSFDEIKKYPSFIVNQLHPDDLLRASIDIGENIHGKSIQQIYKIRDKQGFYHATLLISISFKIAEHLEDTYIFMMYSDLSTLIKENNLYHDIIDESHQVLQQLMLSGLNAHEKDVLFQIGNAKQDKDIAEALNLSIPSIVKYRRKLLRFFNVNTKLDLMRIAFQSGLVK